MRSMRGDARLIRGVMLLYTDPRSQPVDIMQQLLQPAVWTLSSPAMQHYVITSYFVCVLVVNSNVIDLALKLM